MGNKRRKLATSKDQVVQAYENGATLRQIAEVHGVSMGTVRNLLITEGKTLRPTGRPPGPRTEDRVIEIDDLVTSHLTPVTE